MSETEGRRGRRGGGRAGRQATRAGAAAETVAYLVRRLAPVDMLDDEGLARIEENAEIILSEDADGVEQVRADFLAQPEQMLTAMH